jgi:FAD/FMN-containing dehydrogenase
MWDDFYALLTTPPARGRAVLPQGHRFYVLVEAMGGDETRDSAGFEQVLAAQLEKGRVTDAVIAQSRAEVDAIWALRDDVNQLQQFKPIAGFDVSLKLSSIETFEEAVCRTLSSRWPEARLFIFGHVGDGNIHIAVGPTPNEAGSKAAITSAVYGCVARAGGSISAEHGIGIDKRPYLALSRGPEELALMRLIKRSLDPHGILNPGKILEMGSIVPP